MEANDASVLISLLKNVCKDKDGSFWTTDELDSHAVSILCKLKSEPLLPYETSLLEYLITRSLLFESTVERLFDMINSYLNQHSSLSLLEESPITKEEDQSEIQKIEDLLHLANTMVLSPLYNSLQDAKFNMVTETLYSFRIRSPRASVYVSHASSIVSSFASSLQDATARAQFRSALVRVLHAYVLKVPLEHLALHGHELGGIAQEIIDWTSKSQEEQQRAISELVFRNDRWDEAASELSFSSILHNPMFLILHISLPPFRGKTG